MKDIVWNILTSIHPIFADMISLVIKYVHGMSMKQYRRDIRKYNSINSTQFIINKSYPILTDIYENAGGVDDYFIQDLLVANMIYENETNMHYDIGSRLDGFVSHLLSFNQKVTMIDVRPLDYDIQGLSFIQSDATKLFTIKDDSVNSISSLHAIEHFGLGRYGDAINPEGYLCALHEMERVVKPEGYIYLSVPVGKNDEMQFNAQRVFNPMTIVNGFEKCDLCRFVLLNCGKIEFDRELSTYNNCQLGHIFDELKYAKKNTGVFVFRKNNKERFERENDTNII